MRLIRLLFVAVVSISLLAGTTAAADAAPPPVSVQQQKKDPDIDNNSIAILHACVPAYVKGKGWKSYCKNPTYSKRLNAATKWSKKHPKKSDRNPVPYPTQEAKDSKNNKKAWVVYIVTYTKPLVDDHVRLWKYGITSQDAFTKRSAEGARACNRGLSRICDHTYVAATEQGSGAYQYLAPYYRARYWEASLIKRWSRAHHDKCPPGALSCK